jgi:hypothetical protein
VADAASPRLVLLAKHSYPKRPRAAIAIFISFEILRLRYPVRDYVKIMISRGIQGLDYSSMLERQDVKKHRLRHGLNKVISHSRRGRLWHGLI